MKESKFEEKVKIIYLKNTVDKAARLIHFGIKELEGINFINSSNVRRGDVSFDIIN